MRNKGILTAALVSTAALSLAVGVTTSTPPLTAQEELGKALFFDANLSLNSNQSCATCHGPSVGWTGPSEAINMHGAV